MTGYMFSMLIALGAALWLAVYANIRLDRLEERSRQGLEDTPEVGLDD